VVPPGRAHHAGGRGGEPDEPGAGSATATPRRWRSPRPGDGPTGARPPRYPVVVARAVVGGARGDEEVYYSGVGTYPVCGMTGAARSSPPCQHGDSGGPAFVRSGYYVYAVGTIVGVAGNTCYAETVGYEATVTSELGWGTLSIDT